MCCIHGICILAPGANVSANMIFHPVLIFCNLILILIFLNKKVGKMPFLLKNQTGSLQIHLSIRMD